MGLQSYSIANKSFTIHLHLQQVRETNCNNGKVQRPAQNSIIETVITDEKYPLEYSGIRFI